MSRERHRLRLQGGPFDGARHELKLSNALVDPPARLWVERCGICGTHLYREQVQNSELYRRDAEDVKGMWIYVFTDQSGRTQHPVTRAKVPA